MSNRQLTNLEIKNLAEAIDRAFTLQDLDALLFETTNETLDDVSLATYGTQKDHLLREVMLHFNRRGQALRLLDKALSMYPDRVGFIFTPLAQAFGDLETPRLLENKDILKLAENFRKVFKIHELEEFLRDAMDTPLENIVAGASRPKPYLIRDVIRYYNRRSKAQQLALNALNKRKGNADLVAVYESLNFVPTLPKTVQVDGQAIAFEKLVTNLGIENFGKWLENASSIQHKICKIEIPITTTSQINGTGFLVAPNVVMTNYHVVEKVIDNTYSPEAVQLRFDYTLLTNDDDAKVPSTVYKLDTEWLIEASEPDWAKDGAGDFSPDPTKLDFALLRLEQAVGNGSVVDAEGKIIVEQRGWFELPQLVHDYANNQLLIIVQHPDGEPLGIDFNTIRSVNEKQTRVRYKTNTKKGSSGSPCFDSRWNPVALHHVGDRRNPPDYNQGIPLYTIVQSLSDEAKTAVNLPL